VISSINRGKLLKEVAPDKEVTKSFDRMAELLEGSGVKQVLPEKKKGILDSLFRRKGV
jgi:Flp pilus assembly CpaE family ATPase